MCPLGVLCSRRTSCAGHKRLFWVVGAAGTLYGYGRRFRTTWDTYTGPSQLWHWCERCQGKDTPEGSQPAVIHSKIEEIQLKAEISRKKQIHMEQQAETITHTTPNLLYYLPFHRRNRESLSVTSVNLREFDVRMGEKKCLTEVEPGKEKLCI